MRFLIFKINDPKMVRKRVISCLLTKYELCLHICPATETSPCCSSQYKDTTVHQVSIPHFKKFYTGIGLRNTWIFHFSLKYRFLTSRQIESIRLSPAFRYVYLGRKNKSCYKSGTHILKEFIETKTYIDIKKRRMRIRNENITK